MYDVREERVQNKINFLLIVISFISIISVSLFTYSKEELFILPLIFQFISFFVLMKSFFIKKPSISWFKLKSTLENIENNKFNEILFASLKGLEEDTGIYLNEMKKVIANSSSLLIFSIFFMIIILIVSYLKSDILIIITFVLFILYFFYLGKQPKYNYEENYKEFKEKIENWLKSGKIE